jgi:hypothetical protein
LHVGGHAENIEESAKSALSESQSGENAASIGPFPEVASKAKQVALEARFAYT